MYTENDDSFKTIGSKYDIILKKKCGSQNVYRVTTNIMCPLELVSYGGAQHFYKLMSLLNDDIIYDAQFNKISNSEHQVRFELKSVAPQFGIPEKKIIINVCEEFSDEQSLYIGSSPNITNYESEITLHQSQLRLYRLSNDSTEVEYTFHIDLNEDIPIYMEDIPGVLVQKIFFRLKNYFENMK